MRRLARFHAKFSSLTAGVAVVVMVLFPLIAISDLHGKSASGTGSDHKCIRNNANYDPTGYFYDASTGKILTGGSISVIGPGAATIIHDGSSGYYQWVATIAGIYTMTYTNPSGGYVDDPACPPTPGALDPTGLPNPYVLGNGQDGTSGYLTSSACTQHYLQFDLALGDPFVFNNNFPFRQPPELDVQRPAGTSIADDGTDNVGNQAVGPVSLTYTIDNIAGYTSMIVNLCFLNPDWSYGS